tara:strand:+ start:3334 stop:4791 length:1458 start_codon:yes stop_codon:yes gene_type:complete
MSLADMMDYEIKEVPMQSEIRTEEVETLNPASSTTRVFKFKIHNTGFLDSTSMIKFNLLKSATADAAHRLRVNCFNGVLGAIRSATMSCGDFIICETHDCNQIATLRHLNKAPDQRNQFFGHYLGNSLDLEIDSTRGTDDATNGADRDKGQLRVGAGSGVVFGKQSDGTGGAVFSKSIITNKANSDVYAIPLYMLFPAIEGRQMPLFLFQDYPIILEVEFNEASKYINNMQRHPSYEALDTDVLISECKLVVDYVLPPASVISKYVASTQKDGGYRFEYPKFSLVKKSLPATGGNRVEQEVEHRLGQENKEIHKVFQLKQYNAAKSTAMADKVLLSQRIDGCDTEEYNVEVNGMDVYRDDIFNVASQYNELTECLGEPLKIPRAMYFNDCNSQLSHLATLGSGLVSQYKPLGCDLTNGTGAINGGGTIVQQGSPLIWKYKRQPSVAIANVCVDNSPAMTVNYHVMHSGLAVIKKLDIGTSVQVRQ